MSDRRPSLSDTLALTAQIVSAHVSGNAVAPEALPGLIRSVRNALEGVGQAPAPAVTGTPEPAVPIKRSIQRDYLVCLEDGVRVKMLKRYLSTRYDLTPQAYRSKWGLPHDYPMVAPAYAARRSALAKQFGLGRAATPVAEPEPEPVIQPEEVEVEHTLESVFGASDTPVGNAKPAAAAKSTKRKAFSQQFIAKGRPKRTTLPH